MRFAFIFHLLLSCHAVKLADLRFVSLKKGSIQSTKQIGTIFRTAMNCFEAGPDIDSLECCSESETFLLINASNAIAYVNIDIRYGYNPKYSYFYNLFCSFLKPSPIPFLCIYSLFIDEKYRGRGIGKSFLIRSINKVCKDYNLPRDTLITLHLSPKGPGVILPMKMYYKLGFTRGLISFWLPHQHASNLTKLQSEARDIYESIANTKDIEKKGSFAVLICRWNELGRGKELPANHEMLDKLLQDKLNIAYDNQANGQ